MVSFIEDALLTKVTKEYKITSLVYFGASNTGLASVYKEKGKANICYKSFSNKEKSQRSTWRKLYDFWKNYRIYDFDSIVL